MSEPELLARLLRSRDPRAERERALAQPGLDAATRERLERLDVEGLVLSSLLIANLRFQRLRNGSGRAAAWFEADAKGFVEAFRRYHLEVKPTEPFPSGEARLFDAWCAANV